MAAKLSHDSIDSRLELRRVPCALEIEGTGSPDGDEPEDVLVETDRSLQRPAHHRDVVQRLELQRIFH